MIRIENQAQTIITSHLKIKHISLNQYTYREVIILLKLRQCISHPLEIGTTYLFSCLVSLVCRSRNKVLLITTHILVPTTLFYGLSHQSIKRSDNREPVKVTIAEVRVEHGTRIYKYLQTAIQSTLLTRLTLNIFTRRCLLNN